MLVPKHRHDDAVSATLVPNHLVGAQQTEKPAPASLVDQLADRPALGTLISQVKRERSPSKDAF